MTPAAQKNKFEYNLEALRGFAAFTVVVSHCFGFSKVLNGVDARAGVWVYEFPGHLAVLIFFILSGYVIGRATKTRLTWATSGAYLKKRFLRLYPIYLLGVVLAVLVTHNHYEAGAIASNLLFLQRVTAPGLYEIGVNWSLNYEVLFYLLFIPLSIYALKPVPVFLASLAVGFFFQVVVPAPLLSMYGFGFCFWVLGWWLSQTDWTRPVPSSRLTLAGQLLLLLSFGALNLPHDVLQYQLHSDYVAGRAAAFDPTAIAFSDFSYLPLGILMITTFANQRVRYYGWLLAYVVATPIAFLALQLYHSRNQPVDFSAQALPYAFYAAGVGLLVAGYRRRPSVAQLLPMWLVKAGSISYGVYLFHFLVIVLLGRVEAFQGTATSFFVRTLLVLAGAVAVGYLLEKQWQPFAVRQLSRLTFFQLKKKDLTVLAEQASAA